MEGSKFIVFGVLIGILLIAGIYWYVNYQPESGEILPVQAGQPSAPTASQNSQSSTPQPPSVPETPMSSSAVKSFSITVTGDDYNPDYIQVNEGDTVRITLKSTNADHGISFAIPELGVNEIVGPLEENTFEFKASKKGTFIFFCSEVCGGSAGNIKGTLQIN